jgi:hypothetical protein
MCAFAVFFFLYPSLLHFQRAMKAKRRRSNMETLFGEVQKRSEEGDGVVLVSFIAEQKFEYPVVGGREEGEGTIHR